MSEKPKAGKWLYLTEEDAALICDHYCRYPREITDDEEMMRVCEQCPMKEKGTKE